MKEARAELREWREDITEGRAGSKAVEQIALYESPCQRTSWHCWGRRGAGVDGEATRHLRYQIGDDEERYDHPFAPGGPILGILRVCDPALRRDILCFCAMNDIAIPGLRLSCFVL